MNTADDFRFLRDLMPASQYVASLNPKAEAAAERHIEIIIAALGIAERVMAPGILEKAIRRRGGSRDADIVAADIRAAMMKVEVRING